MIEKVASSTVEALKNNPLCLSLLVLVIVLQVIAYYREMAVQEDRYNTVTLLIERCMEPSKR